MTEKFIVEGFGEFEFQKKITFLNREEIENTVAKLIGGRIELTTIKIKLDELQRKLDKEENLFNSLMDLGVYNDTKLRLNNFYQFATLKVLLTKTPPDFNVNHLDEKELNTIYSAYEVALKKPFPPGNVLS